MLTSWKEIARFFGKGLRTVQRWELHGMPVHRPTEDKCIVFADEDELRRWALRRQTFVGQAKGAVPAKVNQMLFHEQTPLTRAMENHLGRELTSSERRLLLLAEELIEREKEPHAKAQAAK